MSSLEPSLSLIDGHGHCNIVLRKIINIIIHTELLVAKIKSCIPRAF